MSVELFFLPNRGIARGRYICVCVCVPASCDSHICLPFCSSPPRHQWSRWQLRHIRLLCQTVWNSNVGLARTHIGKLLTLRRLVVYTRTHTHTSTHTHRWWEKSAQLIVGVGIEFRIDEIQDAGSRQSRQMFYFLDAASSRISVGLFRSSHTLDWSSRSLVKEKTVFYIDTGLHSSGFIFSAIKHRTQVSCRLVEKSSRFLNDRGRLSLRSTEVGIYIHFTIFPSSFRRLFPHWDEQDERGKEKKTPDSLFLFTISISISRLIWKKKKRRSRKNKKEGSPPPPPKKKRKILIYT